MTTALRLRKIFNNPAPPKVIWESQFDGADEELAIIGRKDWQDITEADLWFYILDLTYCELQPDLFAHLFPVCLKFWYDTLMRDEEAARGEADLHAALLRGQILQKMVTPQQREAIYDFMHDAFIERLQQERGFVYTGSTTPAYGWMERFNSLGLVVPLTQRLWESWWSLDHPGKAVSAILWSTGLVYERGENPLFPPWNGATGGGGPYLTQSDTSIYDSAWLPENLQFLKTTLTTDYLQAKLSQAAASLQGEPEYETALSIANQAKEQSETIEFRIVALLEGLNTTWDHQSGIW